jgi:hypothetical protein
LVEHRITINGQERVIDIRAMDESFIVYRKMYKPPLTRENISVFAEHDDVKQLERFKEAGWLDAMREFLRKQIRTIGSCAILAWEGDGVIGKMRFTTREMQDAISQAGGSLCVDSDTMATTIMKFTNEQLDRLLASESKTLWITCFNIGHSDTRYQGQGIATAMVEFLKSWARQRGWRHIEALSCADVVPYKVLGPQILRQSAWERRGFHLIRAIQVSPTAAEKRRKAIERIISGDLWPESNWYMRDHKDNIEKVRQLARDPKWQKDCDKDYVMAYDL